MTALQILALVFVVFLVVVIFDFARLAFLRLRWNRRMTALARDVAWRHWIGMVETRVQNVACMPNAKHLIARDAEWFHDLWKKDFTAFAAVEKWLADKLHVS